MIVHEAILWRADAPRCLGAPARVRTSISPGDVGVLPAGTGLPRQQGGARQGTYVNSKVPLPASDPMFQAQGPLVALWRT
jgi:uncharacterized protein YjlB